MTAGDPPLDKVFLLDVDGVLNVTPIWDGSRKEASACPWPGGWRTFDAAGYLIKYAPDLCKELVDIHRSGLAEVRWLTTWAEEANAHLAERFGFPHFAVVGALPDMAADGWWKLPLAIQVAERSRLVVWADDDLASSDEAQAWAQQQPNVLTLVPDHYVGLTPEHVARAREFLEAA